VHVLVVPAEHYLTGAYPLGGVFQQHQAAALVQAGHRVGVLATGVISPRFALRPYAFVPVEHADGVAVYRDYWRTWLPHRWFHSRSIATRIARGLALYERYERERGRPDVIHAHDLVYAACVAQAVGLARGIPVVVTEHSSAVARQAMPGALRTLAIKHAKTAASVTAVSRFLADQMEALLGPDAPRVHTLPNVLPPGFGTELAMPDPDGFTIFTVGSLDANKDHEMLIRAFARLDQAPVPHLRIAGDGPLRGHLSQLCARLGVTDRVAFLGRLSSSQVRQELSRSHCFTSTSHVETFGVSLIEALAMGVPVIATASGGPSEFVTERDGLLVPPASPEALTEALRRLRREHGDFSPADLQRRCIERFGAAAFARRAAELYEAAIVSGHNR